MRNLDKIARFVGAVVGIVMAISMVYFAIKGESLMVALSAILALGYGFMYWIHDAELKAMCQFEDQLEVCNV